MSLMYLRKISPSTGYLYSAAETEPRRALAVSQRVSLNSWLVMYLSFL